MKFRKASLGIHEERFFRKGLRERLLSFGIDFLDDAMIGIMPSDLILIGAPAGVGKTHFCCNLAYQNVSLGKRVHYIALEAEQYEIERRIKFQIFADLFFKDPNRPKLESKISYDKWYVGDFYESLAAYDILAAEKFEKDYENLFILYKQDDFGLDQLIEKVMTVSHETDLIIVDHVHYFDFEDDNENRAMKEIAKTARMLALEKQIPIVLVAHLRKKDRNNKQLVAGMEEFHGTSDLYKIATKVVTFSPGPKINSDSLEDHYHTFFRIPKNRINGSVTRYIASVPFSVKGNKYESEYRISKADGDKFQDIGYEHYPTWARKIVGTSGDNVTSITRQSTSPQREIWKGYV